MTSIAPNICASCTRYQGFDDDHPQAWCAAFPAGIPDKILFWGYDHRQPFPGDHGILYDPATDKRSKALLGLYEQYGKAEPQEAEES